VETLRKLLFSLFALAFIFTFNITAFAEEGHSHDSNIKQDAGKFKNGSNTNQKDVGENQGHSNHTDANLDSTTSSSHTEYEGTTTEDEGTHEEHQGTHEEEGHGTSKEHSYQDHSGQDEGGHESEGHHGPVVETPPNYKVLGTYGAVNLSFILIGVWNKWFRRKENK
jgi:hypothetical protein